MRHATLYLVGTAGCGKSCLAAAFASWMETEGYKAGLVNLDPGAERLPYEPDFDVREWVSLEGVMAEHDLGPNGAQVAAADIIALNSGSLAEELAGIDCDYMLVDTPGQLELFAFRSSSRVLVDRLGRERAALAFLFDPNLVRAPSGFASAHLLASTVELRLSLPTFSFLSKCDLLEDDELEVIQAWGREPSSLISALEDEAATPQTQLSVELMRALEGAGICRELCATSAETRLGMEDIYSHIQLAFGGGEDLEKR
jgi:GTPase SAR1 family protein